MMPPSSSYPTGPVFGLGLGKGKERDTGHGERVANGAVHPTSSIPRLDTTQQPYYTPPSPPPSVSPTDEKSFEAYTTPSKPIFVETPAALLSAEQQHIIAYQDAAHPPDAGIPARTRPQRSGTLPALPSSSAPVKSPLDLEHSFSDGSAPYTRVTRASEDGPSASTATVVPPTKAQTVTLATPDAAFLHPPPPAPRPTRRNTTGSSSSRPPRRILNAHGHMSLQASGAGPSSQGFPSAGDDGEPGELDSDILKEAEQIRAERRAKAQQEIEEAMTAPKRAKPGSVDQDGPLVGNLIGEDHVNYVLMYNMLTGIRVAVSRVSAALLLTVS